MLGNQRRYGRADITVIDHGDQHISGVTIMSFGLPAACYGATPGSALIWPHANAGATLGSRFKPNSIIGMDHTISEAPQTSARLTLALPSGLRGFKIVGC
jgi:hypothetical protein